MQACAHLQHLFKVSSITGGFAVPGPSWTLKAAVCTVNLAIALLFSTYMDDGVSVEFSHGFQPLQVSNQFVVTFHVNNTLVRREETKALMLALHTPSILFFPFCSELLLSPVKLLGASCSPVIWLSQEEEGIVVLVMTTARQE